VIGYFVLDVTKYFLEVFFFERVELYLYSPYGPYGLHRASVPVKGRTLPFLLYLHALQFVYIRP